MFLILLFLCIVLLLLLIVSAASASLMGSIAETKNIAWHSQSINLGMINIVFVGVTRSESRGSKQGGMRSHGLSRVFTVTVYDVRK